ncbi:hypothetical protein jhhlp_004622 [Lomentospora prolificans]|uniref:Nuclear cap-binding protein subunit 2 n=1 Tax=Lomentospora prolificans TaxID=41688 RepID=A0A2N3NC40_9PEZI|nr:hypothetical protein jhhlp_004622 [Lomentospora prolificans]
MLCTGRPENRSLVLGKVANIDLDRRSNFQQSFRLRLDIRPPHSTHPLSDFFLPLDTMAAYVRSTVDRLDRPSAYFSSRSKRHGRDRRDRDRDGDEDMKEPEQPPEDPLKDATTLYVGNLSFYTTEEQVYELFSKVGEIKRLVMGLDRFTKTPCGFCFVEYYTHQDALDCMKYIGGTKLDERIIRTDLDPGFEEGRQYGRGKSGGQVRDEYREDFDEGRGGLGRALQAERLKEQERARGETDYGKDR